MEIYTIDNSWTMNRISCLICRGLWGAAVMDRKPLKGIERDMIMITSGVVETQNSITNRRV